MNTKEVLVKVLLFALAAVGVPVLTWVSVQLVKLSVKVEAGINSFLTARVHNEWLRGLLVRLDSEVWTVVRFVEQTFVQNARDPSGKLTPESAKLALQKALDALKTNLGATWLQKAEEILGVGTSLDQFLTSKLEAVVNAMPSTAPAVTTAPTPATIPASPLAPRP